MAEVSIVPDSDAVGDFGMAVRALEPVSSEATLLRSRPRRRSIVTLPW
jgi:hypothetical protein